MAGIDFSKKLKTMGSLWKKAAKASKTSPAGSMDNIPDGTYVAVITGAVIEESQSSQRLQVKWTMVITDGEMRGEILTDYNGLNSEEALTWFARRLLQLGYEAEELDLTELPELLESIVGDGVKLRVKLSTKGDYRNIRIQKVLGTGATPPKPKKPTPAEVATPTPAKKKVKKPEPEEVDDDEEEEDDEEAEEEAEEADEEDGEDEEEDSEEDEDGGDPEIAVGSAVVFFDKGVTRKGKVKAIKGTKATVWSLKLKKNFVLNLDDITLADETDK